MFKKSFFERLTGSVNLENEEESQFIDPEQSFDEKNYIDNDVHAEQIAKKDKNNWLHESEEGQLTIDMFQTPNEIIVQSTIAGVKPDDLDISITRDMVTIKGKRQKSHSISKDDYFYQELYWGQFSRSILLPQEIDTEAAEATIKNGMLVIKLPKIDKNRVQKIRVKSE
jgi:HSP20 family protein